MILCLRRRQIHITIMTTTNNIDRPIVRPMTNPDLIILFGSMYESEVIVLVVWVQLIVNEIFIFLVSIVILLV